MNEVFMYKLGRGKCPICGWKWNGDLRLVYVERNGELYPDSIMILCMRCWIMFIVEMTRMGLETEIHVVDIQQDPRSKQIKRLSHSINEMYQKGITDDTSKAISQRTTDRKSIGILLI